MKKSNDNRNQSKSKSELEALLDQLAAADLERSVRGPYCRSARCIVCIVK